jgi:hypothetical protein
MDYATRFRCQSICSSFVCASYSSSFVENAVNGEVLLDADFAANLVELGVLSKMYQNRIAKEIAKLGA